MRTCLLALAAVMSSASLAAAGEHDCGDGALADEALAAIEQAAAREEAKEDEPGATYRIPVYLHVIRRAPGGEGDMPVAHAHAITIDAINSALAEQEIPFVLDLVKIDYTTTGPEEYNLVQYSDEEKELFDELNVDGRRNLNIYIVGPRDDTSVTGWAEFLVNPALFRGDHIVLRYYPRTRGFSDPLVPLHEFGHWMGLLHTFHFGCGAIRHSDLIYDTPAQAAGHHTCSAGYDSCPTLGGPDANDNIMGYSSCRKSFSPGQIKRMKFLWRTARGGKSDDEVVEDTDEVVVEDDAEHGGCAVAPGTSLLPALLAFGFARRRRGVKN